ncbi:unnamed protein product [Chironomus riparius]|uniref:Peptidase S1 domain-containing protein n=1 Tax=Chironomus riparius TaxID=315576 RepID=A0A9P0IU64_9DIPT|nr:unnamed protein product [Chironomus riparius]
MISRNLVLLLFILILICNFVQAQEDACTLPDGISQSSCIYLQRCDHFQNQIKQYGGRPPQSVVNDIRAHLCVNPKYVCCPVPPTTTIAPVTMLPIPKITTMYPPPPEEIQFSLEQIRQHQNYRLINANSCGLQTSLRIAKGIKAVINEFPWAVLLGYNDGLGEIVWDCGGNLISEQYVLTAAHCIRRDLEIARLGEHTISTERDCDNFGACTDPVQEIKIEKAIKHPEYGKPENKHDIGLVKLAVLADTTKLNVRTICLPTMEAVEITKVKSRNFTMTGWGKSEFGIKSDVLLKTELQLVESSLCSYKDIFEEKICAGGFNKLHTCRGGGLTTAVEMNRRPKVTLYGVLSRGVNCEESTEIYPDIYMNVKYYFKWILDNMS